MTEITNLLRGDLLSENPQQAASSFGPHRVVPDRWKGMTQEQLEQIRLVQKQQVQEKLVAAPPLFPSPQSCLPGTNVVVAGLVLCPRTCPQGISLLIGGEDKSQIVSHPYDVASGVGVPRKRTVDWEDTEAKTQKRVGREPCVCLGKG